MAEQNSVQTYDPVKAAVSSITGSAGAPVRTDPVDLLPEDPQEASRGFLKTIKDTLAQRESGNNYYAQSPNSSAAGKYQFIDSTRNMFAPDSTRESFLQDPQLQEDTMDKLLSANMSSFQKAGIDTDNMPKQDLAGLLWAAHLQGAGAATKLYQQGLDSSSDANGVTASNYFRSGSQAYLKSLQNPTVQSSLFDAPGERVLAQYQGSGRLPVNTTDYILNSFGVSAQGTQRGNYKAVADQIDPILDKVASITGQRPDLGVTTTWDRLTQSQGIAGDPIQDLGKRFNSMISTVKSQYPDANLGAQNFSDVLNRAAKDMDMKQKEVDDQASQVSLLPRIGGEIAKAAAWMSDPMNMVLASGSAAAIAASAPALAATWLGSAAIGAASTAFSTGAQQHVLQSEHEDLGQPHGVGEALHETGEAAIGGAVGGLIGHAGGKILSALFGKKAITEIHTDLNTGKGDELAKTITENGGDASAIQRISDTLKENPAGNTTDALPGLTIKTDKIYTDIMQGKQPSPLPQGIIGVKGDIPASPLDEHIIAHLHQEGFADADKVSEYLSSVRKSRGNAGDLTPEEWSNLPVPDKEVPSILQRVTEGQQEQQLKLSEQAKDLPTSAAAADSELQNKLSQWGTTPEAQIGHLNYSIQQLTDQSNKYEFLLNSDEDYKAGKTSNSPWTESKGYEAKVSKYGLDEAEDQARRHTSRQLEKNRNDLLQLEDLKKSVNTKPAETIDPAVNRLNNLKVDLPNAQAVLTQKMDLASSQIKGLSERIDYNTRQTTIYKTQLDNLKSGMVEASEGVEKWAAEQQRYPIKQMVDELTNDTKSAKAHQQRLQDQLQEHSTNLKELHDSVSNLRVEDGDMAPLAKAEDLVRQIREQQAHENTRYPLQSDQFGNASEIGSTPKMVQDTAEKYSALKALKDCIG